MSKTTIPTAGLADDAVDNTKLDLTANYAFTGTITGAGQFKLLSTQTASNDSTINFDNSLITSTYDHYMFTFNNIRFTTDGADIYINTSVDNGSNFPASHSYYSNRFYDGTYRIDQQTSQSSVRIFSSVDGTNSNNNGLNSGVLHLFNGNGSNTHKGGFCTMVQSNQSGNVSASFDTKFSINNTGTVNYVRFSTNTGNYSDGEIKLYGVN
jgi:hypothetical protein